MTDPRTDDQADPRTDPSSEDTPIGRIDELGQPLAVEQIIPPEQPPMDDAAGPQTDELTTDEVETDDLSVQGGE